jgi:class 3 adenylate cyclase/tetratricopeptide (TPR) repeat protein
MICGVCGGENQAGKKFCGDCGAPLAAACPACGAANEPGKKFCGDCGSALAPATGSASVAAASAAARDLPTSERRLVSVLFADLVGFTTLSESRDAEEVRELLSKYFDTCSTLIRRYGGVVEKFIGDAVMAVWGTPVATEDDAERAVRAALDLTKAVAELGAEAGAPDLRARAGVLTGEAAVTLGAEGQGMVAGDMVNTASRIQSAAKPGLVYVGESTARATEASIVYEDAGEHELKGKAEPVPLFRAVRVVAGSLGAQRSSTLEAPFVGRDRELRMIKELLHASAEERKAQLVSVTGIAGIGKTRLSWEFEKYVDGLAETTLWHRGRCLSYGEGVAYWALVDMVKMRCRIAEEEGGDAFGKLHSTVEAFVSDPEERRWIEPRLAHLLGLDGATEGDQENIFSAWRLFFERLAEHYPVIMVFEDMQWADDGLLDFIEHLLEWSRNHPIFILALALPELADRRPTWGAGKRGYSSTYLEPLSEEAMEELVTGLVPGLAGDPRARILERAEGVPLYAVETVRMLLDRGLVVREGSVYRPTGPIESLEVPDTLHALIAARLDGLTPDERRAIQNAAVLGKVFFKQGLAAVSGMPEFELEPLLTSLVRKELVSLQADPRSPERGQYGFLQDLVKKVAYETLAKKDRKAKHLAAAAFIEQGWSGEEEEIVEVVAAHYLDAYEAAPDASDAEEIRSRAREQLVRAAERAASLAAPLDAQRHFEQAAQLSDDVLVRAELLGRAGVMAREGGRLDQANLHLEAALATFEENGEAKSAARILAYLGDVVWRIGSLDDAIDRMERSFDVLSKERPDAVFANVAAELGRLHFFRGEKDLAAERVDAALEVAESIPLPEVISQALNTKGIIQTSRGRPFEGFGLLRYSLEIALDNDMSSAALRAYNNLAELLVGRDRLGESLDHYEQGLALARRTGNSLWLNLLLEAIPYPLFMLGRWDEALERANELPDWAGALELSALLTALPTICVNRGDNATLERVRHIALSAVEDSGDVQKMGGRAALMAVVDRAEGRPDSAFASAKVALHAGLEMGTDSPLVRLGFSEAVDSSLDLGDLSETEELIAVIDRLRPSEVWPSLRALRDRAQTRLMAARGETTDVDEGFQGAEIQFRAIGVPYWLGGTLTEHGEWLAAQDRSDEARVLLDEAQGIFENLQARPWLERSAKLSTPAAAI